jgi:hypothetical protein
VAVFVIEPPVAVMVTVLVPAAVPVEAVDPPPPELELEPEPQLPIPKMETPRAQIAMQVSNLDRKRRRLRRSATLSKPPAKANGSFPPPLRGAGSMSEAAAPVATVSVVMTGVLAGVRLANQAVRLAE